MSVWPGHWRYPSVCPYSSQVNWDWQGKWNDEKWAQSFKNANKDFHLFSLTKGGVNVDVTGM